MTLSIAARDALLVWVRRFAQRLAASWRMTYWVDEAEHAANVALGKALLRYDGDPAEVQAYAAPRVWRAVRRAMKVEKKRRAREVLLEDLHARRRTMHGELVGEEIARAVVDDLFTAGVVEGVQTHGEAATFRREAYEALHAEIDRLKPRQRKLVELRYWGELTWKQVAREIGTGERRAQALDEEIREQLADAVLAWDRVRPIRRET